MPDRENRQHKPAAFPHERARHSPVSWRWGASTNVDNNNSDNLLRHLAIVLLESSASSFKNVWRWSLEPLVFWNFILNWTQFGCLVSDETSSIVGVKTNSIKHTHWIYEKSWVDDDTKKEKSTRNSFEAANVCNSRESTFNVFLIGKIFQGNQIASFDEIKLYFTAECQPDVEW